MFSKPANIASGGGASFAGVRKTIAFRLTLWYAATFAASALLLIGISYFTLSRSLALRDNHLIRGKLNAYAIDWERGGASALRDEVAAERRTHNHEDTFIRLAGPLNETQIIEVPHQLRRFDWRALERRPVLPEQVWMELPAGDEGERVEIAVRHLPDGSLLQVGKSTDERDDVLEQVVRTFAIVIVPVMVMGLAGGVWLTRRALRPIRDLTNALRPIVETGSLKDRAPIRSEGNELDDLAALFNRALGRITLLIDGMRDSLDNVAHDLRTPMTRLRATAELALHSNGAPGKEPNDVNHPSDAASYREALSDCLEESAQVLTMLNTMMDVSEAEAGAMKLDLEPIRISEVMDEAVDIYQYAAEDKQIQLQVREPTGLTWVTDRNRLRQALANLLDNAVKYSSPGGRVYLEAHQEGDELSIAVSDTGMGISSEDLPRIWDRLYRGDKSRSQRGLGLGLSMVRAIVAAHRGRVTASSEVGRGSTFRLYLPKASATSQSARVS
jgi:signal transduction histidine kinase